MNTNSEQQNEIQESDNKIIELLFKFAILMEYQLLDLQFAVRKFVTDMNNSVMNLDQTVTQEGIQAQQLFESIFNETERESSILNTRANYRVDDIIKNLLDNGVEGISPELIDAIDSDDNNTEVNQSPTEENLNTGAKDPVWSKISKKLESVCRLEERLRPHVYQIIQCLNFEDIQTQRLDHLLAGYKLLNQGLMKYIKIGEHSLEGGSIESFTKLFTKKLREMYSMEEERKIFDQVFEKNNLNLNKK